MAPQRCPSARRPSMISRWGKIGRRERIRTSGPHVPNVVLYQAELLSGPCSPPRRRRTAALLYRCLAPPATAISANAKNLFRRVESGKPRLYGPPPCLRRRRSGLGRSQAVRHWILIPAYEGSNPSAPANPFSSFLRKSKTPRGGGCPRGACRFSSGLRDQNSLVML